MPRLKHEGKLTEQWRRTNWKPDFEKKYPAKKQYRVCKRLVCHQHSFFPRTIKDWNSLPVSVIESENIDTFTNYLLSI